ncbi:MAG TPA: tetratricopeptide repeat protein [Phycisphaerae bacterium]|nr:tetratricopeptide repeat protein [Phycisphaerae bacterium]
MPRRPDNIPQATSCHRWLVVLVLAAGALAYANSLSGPFIFDDLESIPQNPNIRQLWPVRQAMAAPPRSTIVARPVVSLSLALNYAVGGLDVRGYHVFNIAVHLASSLLLMGVVRRTLLSPAIGGRYDRSAHYLAAAVAMIWTVHPLQAESVTYIIQRTELLMALFALLTLYCAVRGWTSGRGGWFAATIASCVLGMGSKETMVVAPLLVLLYDRAFVSGTFRQSLKDHRGLYIGLAASYLVLAIALATGPPRETAGFGLGISWWDYLKTQAGVIVWYWRLCFWPDPLVISYHDWPIARRLADVWPQCLLVMTILATCTWALRYRPTLGFLGGWFFLILAPTSSIYPMVLEIAGERRMYLPLAAVTVLVVVVGHEWIASACRRLGTSTRRRAGITGTVLMLVVTTLCGLTSLRNRDYRDELTIWRDTVEKRPGNSIAHNNLATVLIDRGEIESAWPHVEAALRIEPTLAEAHNNHGVILAKRGRVAEAASAYRQALALKADYPQAHTNLGRVFTMQGNPEEALRCHMEAVQLDPHLAEARNNLATVLSARGDPEGAIEHLVEAVRLKPDFMEAHYNLGNILAQARRLDEAILQYRKTLELSPDHGDTLNNLGAALYHKGLKQHARDCWERALRNRPDSPEIHTNLGGVCFEQGDAERAFRHWQTALRLDPDFAPARAHLEMALSHNGHPPKANPTSTPAANGQ